MEGQGESKEDAIDGGDVSCAEYESLLFYLHLFNLTQKEIKQTHGKSQNHSEKRVLRNSERPNHKRF